MDSPPRSECMKLAKEQVIVAKGMEERGVSVPQLARHIDVTEGALRHRLKKVEEPTRDGWAGQPTALDGYEDAVLAVHGRPIF